MSKIIFTVINDIQYDQRMHRIVGSLATAGHEVLLIGRKNKDALIPDSLPFRTKRLTCFCKRGMLMYIEFNLRLLFYLIPKKADIICAIDLDTILPVYMVTLIKNQKRVYDAHELFTEQKEIISRPFIHAIWLAIERFAVPKFKKGYTVNSYIAAEFLRRYNVNYEVIRNLPRLTKLKAVEVIKKERWIIYQGAVNEGRCFETLIPAMKEVNARLFIYGIGNFFEQTKTLIKQHQVENKVILYGTIDPKELAMITPNAYLGITLFESTGMNQYYSLSNRFFDYTMAGIPQVCVAYPAYQAVNQQFKVAYPIDNTDAGTISRALNNLLVDDVLYFELTKNCLQARMLLNWENEEPILLNFYHQL